MTMQPRPQRLNGADNDLSIRYAVGDSSLGAVLVARSERGVCALLLGDDRDELLRDLHRRFPGHAVTADIAGLSELVARVLTFVESPARGLDAPLDPRGTEFQRQVWQALREIPSGATATYSEIAGQIQQPRAARAVARACAANPLAVAIPCHRVVRSDGGLSGYRWGVERKRVLLDREAQPSERPSKAQQ